MNSLKIWSSWFRYHSVVLWADADVLEKHAAYVFRDERCRFKNIHSYEDKLQGRVPCTSLRLAYIIKPVFDPANINPEDGGSLYNQTCF
jgi:hypothetical protein